MSSSIRFMSRSPIGFYVTLAAALLVACKGRDQYADTAAGEFAKTRAQNARVREFAQRMVRDHGAVNKQAVALATRLNMTPAENDVSRQLQQGDQQARNDLAGKRGAEFDRAYIDHEIQYHQAVLDALDKTLIPGAQNADLKALLQQVRPNVAAHLQLAQQIQSTLGRQ
jgi:putative membrane protein